MVPKKILVVFFDQQSVASKTVDIFPPDSTNTGETVIIDDMKCIPIFQKPIVDETGKFVMLAAVEKFEKAERSLVTNGWRPIERRQADTLINSFPIELSETVLEAIA